VNGEKKEKLSDCWHKLANTELSDLLTNSNVETKTLGQNVTQFSYGQKSTSNENISPSET